MSLIQQGNKLFANGGSSQGKAVSLSPDGNTLVVGGRGSIWIFTRSGTSWTLLSANQVGSGGDSVESVSLSSDGNTIAAGTPFSNGNIGETWIYVRNGTSWSQQGSPLVGSGYSNVSNQGRSVSLSSDGNTLAVGGDIDDNSIGATWIFTRSGTTWSQQGAKLVGSDPSITARRGSSVALTPDGNTLVVGGESNGSVWIWTRSGTSWINQQQFPTSLSPMDSLSLSSDGNTLACGRGFFGIGETRIFVRNGTSWSQQGSPLVGTGSAGSAAQGSSVSLSSDGNKLAIGGHTDDRVGNDAIGATWIFTRSGTTWTQQGEKLVGTGYTGPSCYQGYAVSLSSDGNTLAVGGHKDNNNTGATWIFATPTPLPPTPIPTPLPPTVEPNSGPPSDNSFAHVYVGPRTDRPATDAHYNYLYIGTENMGGLVHKDGSWNNISFK